MIRLAVISLCAALAGCAVPSARTQGQVLAAQGRVVTQEELGIRVTALHLTGADTLLDFRFDVLDAAKAAPLFDFKQRPLLVDEASGTTVTVPDTAKIGALRTTARGVPVREHRGYAMLFANPGKHIRPGTPLVLVVGERKLAGLTAGFNAVPPRPPRGPLAARAAGSSAQDRGQPGRQP